METKKCEDCNGTGIIEMEGTVGPSGPCPVCDGNGILEIKDKENGNS